MKKIRVSVLILVLCVLSLPLVSLARDVAPVVDTAWVEKNINNPKVVIVDIRKVEDYKAGHIPNAVNAFYGSWAMMKGGMRNELPAADDLFDVIGGAGIGSDSIVVLAGKNDNMSDRADPTRVAWTLKYAGVQNIAILDGGYNKWTAEKKALSTDAVKPKAKPYKATVNAGLFVNKDYVMKSIGKAVIVDVREPDFYKGAKKLDFVSRPGHIAKAVNLPTASKVYKQDGTYKDKTELMSMASAVVGKDMGKEIIAYCDTGKIASVWSFLLTDLLGYKDVKIYDGSAEEWSKDPKAPLEQ